MDILAKLREVTLSVLPIAVIASVLSFVTGVMSLPEFAAFAASCVLVILGLTLFLTGVDNGLLPIGNRIGSSITRSRSLVVIITVAVALGFIITIAEPDVKVLAGQINQVNPSLGVTLLLVSIGAGVGIFLALSLLRTILHIPLKIILMISYLLVLVLASVVPPFFVAIGFDAGGATTGPMSVPFIMALGMGLARTRSRDEESEFGYVAMSSIGPVLAVFILGAIFSSSPAGAGAEGEHAMGFFSLLLESFSSTGAALLPLLAVCIIMQLFVMKLPFFQALKLFIGIFYAYIGLVLFSTGVEFSFSSVARQLGGALASSSPMLLAVVGGVLGACVVLAEPAIWVLTEQVEEVSGGRIKRMLMMVTLCIAVSAAVMLSLLRTTAGLSILYFVVPGYAIILLMMIFTPKLFSAIAFDSGGVATGPMSSAFLLPFAIGAAGGSADSAFGLIALIAMMPIFSIEILGLIFRHTVNKGSKGGAR